MAETLHLFCEKNPSHVSPANMIDLFADSPYEDLILSFYKAFFMNDDPKRRCVWFHGQANAGKTRIAEILKKIFYCQKLVFTEGKYTVGTNTTLPYAA
jgi:hypothetical protein